ncbi:acyl carrier protein [Frankia sp. CiP3]|uniref:acyl carrier protein n=1 Tax=Frankia sp. CiP3 TaxID=2880971 RepID=UPI001EF684A3|nr:acyl carrier protein [Frankia sp. CiP3]
MTLQPDLEAVRAETIKEWLVGQIAFYTERPKTELRTDVKLVEYGLDSVYAMTLCGDIEDEYGLAVEPTLTWHHPTVDSIAELLHFMLCEQAQHRSDDVSSG